MKKGNLTIWQLIDKFFKSGKKSVWKSKWFLSAFSGLTLVSATAITTTCILLQPQPQVVQLSTYKPTRPQLKDSYKNVQVYAIDNHYFKTKRSAINYMYQKADLTTFNYNANHYMFDGQIFPTKSALNNYLKNKFSIEQVKTMRNPENHTINTTGELSKDVLTTDYEQPIRVYKGNDGGAYLTKEEALSTYENYHQIYNVLGMQRFNEYEARELLENSIKKILEDGQTVNKTTCYIQGVICETESEIKQWLRESVKNGFEHKGQYFSDYNYSDFKTVMNNIDDYTVDKYVKEIVNPDKNSYWISHEAKAEDGGFFIGPKYVETSQKLIGNPKFEEVKSFTPSLFLMGAALMPFTNATEGQLEADEKFDWNNDVIAYLKKQSLGNDTYNILLDNLKKLFDYGNKTESKFHQILQDSTIGLLDITDPTMTDFDKCLVAIKRIMLYLHVYATQDAEDDKKSFPDQVEDNFIDIIIQLLNSNKTMMSKFLGSDKGAEILKDKHYRFEDIYNMFLNQTAFFESNQQKTEQMSVVENIQSGVDKLVSTVEGVQDIAKGMEKKYKQSISSDGEFHDMTVKVHSDIKAKINKKSMKIEQNFGIDISKNKIKGIPFVDAAIQVWEYSKMLSFINIKTFEYKIDNENSIYYMVPGFRIPILDIDIPVNMPTSKTTELSKSVLKYMLPVNKQNEKQKVYEFNGHYYLKKENAKDDLINAIYQHPEKYVQNKKLYVSVMSKDGVWKLPSELSEANICGSTGNDNNCITNEIYNEKLNEEKNKFVNQLFTQYYEPNKKEYFLDGFNTKDEKNYFETKQQALASLEEKLAQVKFNPRYRYITVGGKQIDLDTKEEILDYIHNNEIVDSKLIINTDLIISSNYSDLAEYQNIDFDVYHLKFYGDDKYFMSYEQAWNYIQNNTNYRVLNFDGSSNSFSFGGYKFFKKEDFTNWIDQNIVVVKATDVPRRQEVITC